MRTAALRKVDDTEPGTIAERISRRANRHATRSPRTIEALAADWFAAYAQAEAEELRLNAAHEQANQVIPPPPPGSSALRRPLQPHEKQAREHWRALVDAVQASLGIPELDQKTNQAFIKAGEIAKEIEHLRPRSAREAALKYAITLERAQDGGGGIDNASLLFAFLGDLEHLASLDRQRGRSK